MYCAHAASVRPGLLLDVKVGYFDSTSQRRFASRPFSFTPSVVETSKPLATTLPYFAVQWMEFGPAWPLRAMPRGKIQRSVLMSVFQSIDRAVITSPLAPRYTMRVQARAV